MDSAVSTTQAEQLIHDLVAIPSSSHEEHGAVSFLVEWMNTHGYDRAFVDEVGNAVGIIGNGARDIVLLGHIDTFAGSPPVHIDERLLYGRGSVDAKGSLCTFVVAGLQAELPDDVRLIVIGAVEEEAASSKGARHVMTQYQPEVCIIGEPSNWDRITLGYKGRLLLEYRWEGALAHSAGQSASPAEQAFAYWQRVQSYADTYNENIKSLFGRLDATLQEINTGQNGAYGWATMTIGFRLPPNIAPETVADDLIDDDNRANIRPYGKEQAYLSDKDTGLSRTLRGAIRRHGGRPRFVHKTGTADMNIVAPVWRCPIVAYGPGDSALDHTPDEYLDLDEYNRAIAILADSLQHICDGARFI
jgi:[amino group carrier protein]-lysine/ornithine hydrolase